MAQSLEFTSISKYLRDYDKHVRLVCSKDVVEKWHNMDKYQKDLRVLFSTFKGTSKVDMDESLVSLDIEIQEIVIEPGYIQYVIFCKKRKSYGNFYRLSEDECYFFRNKNMRVLNATYRARLNDVIFYLKTKPREESIGNQTTISL